jgi:hypothetical protein
MKPKQTIESQLHCKATAELADSIIDDMLKSDGNLKELLDDESEDKDNEQNIDRSSKKM